MAETNFTKIFQNNPIAISMTNLKDNLFFEVNRSWESMTGYSREEAIGTSPQQLNLWVEPEKRGHLARMIETHGFAKEEVKIKKKSGDIFVVLISAEIIELSADKYLLTMGQDITELKKTEQALRDSEYRYRSMIDSFSDPVCICSSDFRVEYLNTAMVKRLGKDMTGEPCYKAIHGLPERCEWCPPHVIERSHEVNIASPLDNRNFHITNMPVNNKNGSVSQMSIFRDMTDYFDAISDKEQARSQLMQSDKMASIGQLAAGVAHEINNPVGFISSNLKTLGGYHKDIQSLIKLYRELATGIKSSSNDKAVRDLLAKISSLEDEVEIDYLMDDISSLVEESSEGTDRVKIIVNDLKNFAHPGKGLQESVDINKGIESTLNVVSNELKYKANVIKDFGDLPYITGYPQQLNQVFMNLLVNAAHAIEEQGEVSIKTSCDDEFIIVEISDTGSGIPEENLPRLFDPFFTTKEVGKGTGLGLNLVFNIIKKHNGTVDVRSKVGKGTTFTIRLPHEDGPLK